VLSHSSCFTPSASKGTIPFENFPDEMQKKLRILDETGDGQLDAQEILAGIEALQREKDRFQTKIKYVANTLSHKYANTRVDTCKINTRTHTHTQAHKHTHAHTHLRAHTQTPS